MENTKTKKALIMSVLSMVLCIAMLIGMTFAWFTDTASTGVNKIQAGNLNVELEMYDGSKYVNISKNQEPIFGSDTSTVAQNKNLDTLWEPGKTQIAYLAIKNEGNLALKYKVALNVTNPVDGKDLYKVMEYAIVADAKGGATAPAWTSGKSVVEGKQLVSDTDIPLAAGATHYFALLVHMDEQAGNDYQGGKVDFDLSVLATQKDSESDSYGPEYDKNADYPEVQPVGNSDKLKDALTSDDIDGKTIKLYDDIDAENLSVSGKNIALDLNGKKLDTKQLEVKNSTIVIKDSSENGNGVLNTDDSYGVINAANSDVTIESGNFKSEYDKSGSSGYANVIQVRNSNLTINGGHFENTDAVGSYNYLIKAPGYSKTEKTTITINGGEFVSHRNYGYIVTGDSDANVDVIINGGNFRTEGSYSVLTNVTGNVVVNDCTFTATGNHTVFNIPKNSTVTVKGGTYTVNEKAYTDTSLAGLIFHRKTNGWKGVDGTLIVDPVNPVKVNQPTYSGFIASGATQSAKDADGFYTISK